MFHKFNKSNKGFTLIELMIVVVIIGILAALAIPRFMTASTKSKTSEAQLILKQVYTMERSYKQQYDTYSNDLTAIGVELPDPSIRRYDYSVVATATTFTATATGQLDDDVTEDEWTMDQEGTLTHTVDDVVG